MLRLRAAMSLIALASAAVCMCQQALEFPATSQAAFARTMFGKKDKVPPPPACPAKFDDSLETNGVLPMGKAQGLTSPKPVLTPEADFSDKARKDIHKNTLSTSSRSL